MDTSGDEEPLCDEAIREIEASIEDVRAELWGGKEHDVRVALSE